MSLFEKGKHAVSRSEKNIKQTDVQWQFVTNKRGQGRTKFWVAKCLNIAQLGQIHVKFRNTKCKFAAIKY